MDEAAARLQMQVDSKPEELDEIDREIMRLKIEQEALKKETDVGVEGPPRRRSRRNSPSWKRIRRAHPATGRPRRNKLSEAQKLKSELEQARLRT